MLQHRDRPRLAKKAVELYAALAAAGHAYDKLFPEALHPIQTKFEQIRVAHVVFLKTKHKVRLYAFFECVTGDEW